MVSLAMMGEEKSHGYVMDAEPDRNQNQTGRNRTWVEPRVSTTFLS